MQITSYASLKKLSMLTQHILHQFPITFNIEIFPKHLKGTSPFNLSVTYARAQQFKFIICFNGSWVGRIQQQDIIKQVSFFEFQVTNIHKLARCYLGPRRDV